MMMYYSEKYGREKIKLSLKMRSILTVTALVSKGLIDSSFQYHAMTAKKNGVTKTEMAEILTHLAFYVGWPNAWSAFRVVKEVYADDTTVENHGGMFGIGEANTAYAKYFIGNSYLKPLTNPNETVFVANVTFEPGCRNNWHVHHATSGGGQLLLCVDGEGWYQEEGKEPQSLKAGRYSRYSCRCQSIGTVQRQTSWFSHLAVECPGENTSNEWFEPVDDEHYPKEN